MQSSFQLPNEVNCSNKRNSPQTNLEQNKMIATERKRVSTDSTRIARSSEGVPIGTRNVESFGTRNVVNVACGAKTLAQHETTLKILKLVCVVFAVSTVISTATFGGILYNLTKRIENNERASALYDDMEGRLLNVDSSVGTNTAKIEENSKRLTRCETGVVEMETHKTTNQLSDISYRIGILERNQTQDRTEFYNIVTKLENIDAQFGKNTANIEENAKTLVRIETELGAIKTNNESELKDMRQRIGTLEFYQIQESVRAGEFESRLGNLESDVNTYGTIVQNNSNSFSRLETDIWQFELDRAHKKFELRELNTTVHELSNNLSEVMTILETSINGEYDKRISILELDCNLHALIVQNHTMRITQPEKDTSIDASSIQLHEDKIAELTANLTSESSIIKEHSENIAVIKSNLMRLDNSTFVNNVSSLLNKKKFGQLEFDITDLEIKLFAQNVTLQKQSARIEELESDKIRDQDMIINNTLKLSQLKTYVTELKVSRLMETSINLVQSNRLLELELIANETETTLEEYGAKLTNLTESQIGFSASGKTLLPGTGIVQFYNEKTNYGSGYSSTTGKFTCSIPGLYFFSTSLIKLRDTTNKVDYINCYIKKNTSFLIQTNIDPADDDTDKGSYETSAFIVVHLSRGDQVYVACGEKLEHYSSFSGFLIQSD